MIDPFRILSSFLFPPLFTVTFTDGVARCTRGKVALRTLEEFTQVAKVCGLSSGTLHGVDRAGIVLLEFSRDIPEDARQRFRNVWGMVR